VASETVDGMVADCGSKRAYVVLTDWYPLAFLSLLEVRLILSAIGVNHLLPMDCVVSLMSIVLIGNLIYSAASVTHMFCPHSHIEYCVSCPFSVTAFLAR
jgi:hypothetical protein